MSDHYLTENADKFLVEQNARLHDEIKYYRNEVDRHKDKVKIWISLFWIIQFIEVSIIFFWLPDPLNIEFVKGLFSWVGAGFFVFVMIVLIGHDMSAKRRNLNEKGGL